MFKKILTIIVVILVIGTGAGFYVWKFIINKPHDTIENHSSSDIISISADALSKDFTADEKTANEKYLKKVIEVSGSVSEIDTNQDGGVMVVLQTADPMAGVQCAMRDKNVSTVKGQAIIIDGFCSGNGITGVSLTDCIIKRK